MSRTEWARRHVVRTLRSQAIACPEKYRLMLDRTSDGEFIRDLKPWIFLPYPEHTAGYCAEILSQPVLPFAQAIGEDLIACFQYAPVDNPGVIVLNPWSRSKRLVRRAELPSYDIWLSYAFHVARAVKARAQPVPA